MIIVALLASSVLMLAIQAPFVKILVLLGLIAHLFVMFNPTHKVPGLKSHGFWQELAIIGGVIYLMGADVARPKPVAAATDASKKKRD